MSDALPTAAFRFRREVVASDEETVRRLVRRTGLFSAEEGEIAAELVRERLSRGDESGYRFLFAEDGEGLVGYTCWGPTPATRGTFDLYWIAVTPEVQGQGVGRELLARTEEQVRDSGGRLLVVETSDRAQYAPTRAFYERCGFRQAAVIAEFYAPGEGKIIYGKRLSEGSGQIPTGR